MARVDRALRFYEEVLGLGFLHYGWWADDPLTLDGLKAAQARYAERLADWIPEGVGSVLDAGCGTGGNSLVLSARGFEVEGLSPDPFQEERYRARTGRPFHRARLQDFQPGRRYDLVLMSESSQYVPLAGLFPAVARAAPGGWLLLSDYFPYARGEGALSRSGHVRAAFREAAEAAGFTLVREEDVTEAVLPTLRYARSLADRYGRPTLQLVVDTLEERHPWVLRALRWLLRRRITKILAQEELIDADAFRKAKAYEVLLYRVPGAA